MRNPVLVAAVLLLAASVPGAAESAPSCHLVVDPVGDDHLIEEAGSSPASVGSLDITSADVASDDRHVTAVIRLRSLTTVEPGAASGANYRVGFVVDDARFSMLAGRTADGTTRFWVSVSETVGGVSAGRILAYVDGVFDEDASEVRITSRRQVFGEVARIAAGTELARLTAESQRTAGVAALPVSPFPNPYGFTVSNGADEARSDASYAAGSPSCVVVGR